MSCAHGYAPESGHEGIFSVDTSNITFGRGALAEVGALVAELRCKRVALFTDARVAALPSVATVKKSLHNARVDFEIYDAVSVEPTDESFTTAAKFAREGKFDGYVSVGGGSTIDTCKAAMLYATYPADFLAYVNRPVGQGLPVPGPLPPHVACPTTSGTGAELTGIAICDVLALHAKTGIASKKIRPTLAVIDPDVTATLPAGVVAASGFDVLCHAVESLTARPFTVRLASATPQARPMSQGRNPWSDLGSREALRLGGQFLVRAVTDANDTEARESLLWAATLAGLAFGNAGVHLPHAMAYAVAGQVKTFRMPGYPQHEAMVPHGISVVTSAPAALAFTAQASPERHLEAAALLGEDIRGARPEDAGPVLSRALARTMRAADVPVGLAPLGYVAVDVPALVAGTIVQKRLLDNAPRPVDEAALTEVFSAAVGSVA